MSPKRVVSEVTVTTASSDFRCAGISCYQVSSKKCSRCKSIIYCSRVCQETHWDEHKAVCKKIKKFSVKVESEVEEVRNYKDWDGSTRNLFEADVGYFWGLMDPRDYCRARYMLADAMRECAVKNNSKLALELALEHLLDLVWMTRGDNMGCRDIIPGILISLGRMQEAYDFMKWWSVTNSNSSYDWGDLELPFLDLKDEVMSESLEAFHVDKYTDAQALLDLLMIKLFVKAELKDAKDDASKELYKEIDNQTKKIDDLITKANKNLMPLLMSRDKLTDADKPDSYSHGSVSEAYHIVFNSRLAWDKFEKFMCGCPHGSCGEFNKRI